MARQLPARNPLILMVLGAVGSIVLVAVLYHSVQTVALSVAFFTGTGGMGVLFYRWRLKGDRLAQVLCLVAFGTWGLSVVVGSVVPAKDAFTADDPGSWMAGTALLIGFLGAIVVLRVAAIRRRDGRSTQGSADPISPQNLHG